MIELEKQDSTKDKGTGTSKAKQKQNFFLHFFSFNGRIRRLEYNLSLLVYLVCLFPLIFVVFELKHYIALILFIPLLWFYCAQAAKRGQDLGIEGSAIIPLLFVKRGFPFQLMIFKGEAGPNEFGEDPKC
jgi:uncharacterized membrane protein YhaH (DUF805 family)